MVLPFLFPPHIVVQALEQKASFSAIYLLFPSAQKKLRFSIHIFNLEGCLLSLRNLQSLRHGVAKKQRIRDNRTPSAELNPIYPR